MMRSISILCLFVFACTAATLYGQQTYYNTTTTTTAQQPQHQQPLLQQPVSQQQPAQQQPIRIQTLQVPPKSITQNGVTVYQQQENQQNTVPGQQVVATEPRTMPQGFGSVYPTGMQPGQQQPGQQQQGVPVATQPMAQYAQDATHQGNMVRVASAQNAPNRAAGTVQGLPPTEPVAQPVAGHPPIAAGAVSGQPVAAQPGPAAGQAAKPTHTHVGRAEPAMRVPPFFLTPEQEKELDEFLLRWEKYSDGIKLYEVEFTAYHYLPDVNGLVSPNATKSTFGSFKYVAPNRFVYHLEGEWINGEKVWRNEKDETKRLITEEKIIINEKAFFQYDYVTKTVKQINIPPELARKGIADSPLPLIFGAKAADLKRRFSMSMKIVEQNNEKIAWLFARPLLIEDRQEFCQIELMVNLNTFRVGALQKYDINGKERTVYVLQQPKINPPLGPAIEKWKQLFTATIQPGWKHEVEDMTALASPQDAPSPAPARSVPQPQVAGPQPGAVPNNNNTIPLYTPQ